MRNAGLKEAQAGIKIARRNINNFRYADNITLMAECEVKWSEVAQSCPTLCDPVDCSPPGSSVHGILQARILEWVTIKWRRTKEPLDESERGELKSWLKAQHSENEDHGIWSHHFMAKRSGNSGNNERLYFGWFQNHCRWWLQPWNWKTLTPWKKSYDQPRQHIKEQKLYFANKGPSKRYGFSSGHVWMWELDCEESWAPKNWCFWTVVLEKTFESPLDCKIQPVHPKGDQS